MNRPIRTMAAALGALTLAASACSAGEVASASPPPPASAEAPPPQAPAPAQAIRASGPALWQVSDADTTIYLFGTIHALPKDAVWMTDRIASALDASAELVTEVALEETAGVRDEMLKRAMLPEGQNLRALLGEADLRTYQKALASLALPAESFDRFEPWFTGLTLSLLPMGRNGYSAASGVEAVLEARSGPARKHAALETVEYQISLFDAMPQETQLIYLREVSEAVPKMNAMLPQLAESWLAGDVSALGNMNEREASDPVLLDRLLFQRNRAWAKWIEARLTQPGTVFLAVGAGHLAGQGSVQESLAHDGIASTRVQ